MAHVAIDLDPRRDGQSLQDHNRNISDLTVNAYVRTGQDHRPRVASSKVPSLSAGQKDIILGSALFRGGADKILKTLDDVNIHGEACGRVGPMLPSTILLPSGRLNLGAEIAMRRR